MLLFTPEMVLVIDSVKFQTDSLRLPSRVMGERVFLAEVVRVGREEEEEDEDWGKEEELED